MKHFFLIIAFLWCSFSFGQSILLPSDNIRAAFEKQYPGKKPSWFVEYGKRDEDIIFVAKFNTASNAKALALYDAAANFISYKELFSSLKLPKNAQLYLNANYPIVSRSKTKTNLKTKDAPARETYCVVDSKNKTTYEVMVTKDKKNYNLIIDSDGNLIKRIEIQ